MSYQVAWSPTIGSGYGDFVEGSVNYVTLVIRKAR